MRRACLILLVASAALIGLFAAGWTFVRRPEPFTTAPGTTTDVIAKLEQVWPEVQNALVALEPQTPHVFATGSDHNVEIRDPDLTPSVIHLILERARYET
jgi:hypothetical protein